MARATVKQLTEHLRQAIAALEPFACQAPRSPKSDNLVIFRHRLPDRKPIYAGDLARAKEAYEAALIYLGGCSKR